MQHRLLIFVVISVLVVALVYCSVPTSGVFAVTNHANSIGTNCTPTGKQSENGLALVECCWHTIVDVLPDPDTKEKYCSTCEDGGTRGKINCSEPELQFLVGRPPDLGVLPEEGVLEQPPTFSPFNPAAPLQGGVLEQQEQIPPPSAPGASPGILEQLEQGSSPELGFSERQQPPPADQGATELPPPATEQTQPATVEEEQSVPVCQESLEFNEDLGFCVPEDCPEGQVLDEGSGICVLEEPEAAEEEPTQSEPEEENQPSEESDSGEDSNN